MPRTTIRIEQLGIVEPRAIICVDEPAGIPHGKTREVLNCDVSAPPLSATAANSVRDAGQEVHRRLTHHPAVDSALQTIDHAPRHEPCPVFVCLHTPTAEVLPFETLYLPRRAFLALDERAPITRVVAADRDGDEPIERLFRLPLRITAVISAAGRQVNELAEWQALYAAVNTTQLDLELQVLVGNDALRKVIEQVGDDRVQVRMISNVDSTGREKLVQAIGSFEPMVIHFFCHGSGGPESCLAVASDATHDLGEQPIYLGLDEISRAAGTALVVVLNACEGAEPGAETGSLAFAMATGGVPAVIGMREAIAADDANLFTSAFYPGLIAELDRVRAHGGGGGPDWPELLRLPRARLRDRQGGPPATAAAAHKRWSLPVLYQRPERLRLYWATGTYGNELFGELITLRQVSTQLDPATPQEIVTEVQRRITELEQLLSL